MVAIATVRSEPTIERLEQVESRFKWLGEPVRRWTGTVDQIGESIPGFVRRPFIVGHPVEPASSGAMRASFANKYYDVIVRLPLNGDQAEIPVGVVSKKYGLVQHKHLFESCVSALGRAGVDLKEATASLFLSEYGGRMRLSFVLPEKYFFDPGDNRPIAPYLGCSNSVDGSSRLQVMLGWQRLICENGLILRTTRLDLRLVHNARINVPALGQSLSRAIGQIPREQDLIKSWMVQKVESDRLVNFVDGPLKRKWGVRASARAYSICETGYDGKARDPFQMAEPSRTKMLRVQRVPGSAVPARNAFAVSQALAWLAKERLDIGEQVDRMKEIPPLISALVRGKT